MFQDDLISPKKLLRLFCFISLPNIYYALIMLKRLLEKFPNVEYLIAGEGPLHQQLIKQVERLKLFTYIMHDFFFDGI